MYFECGNSRQCPLIKSKWWAVTAIVHVAECWGRSGWTKSLYLLEGKVSHVNTARPNLWKIKKRYSHVLVYVLKYRVTTTRRNRNCCLQSTNQRLEWSNVRIVKFIGLKLCLAKMYKTLLILLCICALSQKTSVQNREYKTARHSVSVHRVPNNLNIRIRQF